MQELPVRIQKKSLGEGKALLTRDIESLGAPKKRTQIKNPNKSRQRKKETLMTLPIRMDLTWKISLRGESFFDASASFPKDKKNRRAEGKGKKLRNLRPKTG